MKFWAHGELFYYDRALTRKEIRAINRYLRRKYLTRRERAMLVCHSALRKLGW